MVRLYRQIDIIETVCTPSLLYVDDMVDKGLEIKISAELLLYTSTTVISMLSPLALLLALLMCFGNFSEFTSSQTKK